MARIPSEVITLKSGDSVLIKTCEPQDSFPFMEFIGLVGQETRFTLQYPERRIPRAGVEDHWRKSLVNPNIIWLAALTNGKMIGQISFQRESPDHPWIRQNAKFAMAVLKAYWGQGVGEALCSKGFEVLRKWGIRRLEATVRTQNERGVAFYKKMGFEIEGTRKSCIQIDGIMQDEYYIAKLF